VFVHRFEFAVCVFSFCSR